MLVAVVEATAGWIFVPEVKATTCVGITLLHVRFHDRLDPPTMRSVLQGYDNRYKRLRRLGG